MLISMLHANNDFLIARCAMRCACHGHGWMPPWMDGHGSMAMDGCDGHGCDGC